MSILDTPRIIFSGQASWDPIVTNNYSTEYNENTSWTVLTPGESAQQFRQAAATSSNIQAGMWNPQGTHRANFFNTAVTGVDNGSGVVPNDPFVTAPAYFDGMLVDVEPYGSFSSQLFFDQMSFGIDGGCRILAPRTRRFTARYINFYRLPRPVYNFAASVASVVWQASFAKADGLQIDPYDSSVLQTFNQALQKSDVLGLTVRFNAYSTHYYGAATDSEIPALETALAANIAGGGFQPNPARSKVVGVIGLWLAGEPAHEPGDRAMLADLPGPPHSKFFVASAFAKLTGNQLTVDMGNSISEIDLQETKENLGTLTFSAVDVKGNPTTVGTLDYSKYNRDAYQKSAGIVTLNLNSTQAQAAKDGNLRLTSGDGTLCLSEQPLRAIPCDPNIYINSGEQKTTEVMVLNKGVSAGPGIQVQMLASPSVATAMTNSQGIAPFVISGSQGQVQGAVLKPGNVITPNSINPQLTTYVYIRTLQDVPPISSGLPATWQNVYQYVLLNWNAMAPCMDNWLDLNDESQVKAYGPIIKKLTDPANFESYRFMPITRDMTQGERQLLYRFLDGVQEAPLQAEAEAAEAVDYDELSRQMRQAKRAPVDVEE